MTITLDIALPVAALLLSLRIGALLVMSPLFTAAAVPARIRVLWLLAVSALLVLGHWPMSFSRPDGMLPLALASLTELVNGAALGFGVFVAWAAVQTAARLIDLQMGLGVAAVFDPVTHSQTPALVTLFNLLAVYLFLAMEGHQALVRALAWSLQQVPLGTGLRGLRADLFVGQMALAFSLALSLAIPVLLALMLADLALFALSRALPQMNVLIVAMPAKVMLGMLLLALFAPALAGPINRIHNGIFRFWQAAHG